MASGCEALERLFAGLDGEPCESSQARLRAFQVILALVIATEYWLKAILYRPELTTVDRAALLIVTVLAIGVVEGRLRRRAFAGIALLQIWYVVSQFPQAGNHRYLEAFFAILLAGLDDEQKEDRLWMLRAVRWSVIVVLFYSGLHKLLHGFWTNGQYLAYSLWREGFHVALEPLFRPEEFARVASFTGAVGDGPYTGLSLQVRVLSNLVWMLQLALAPLLYFRRMRAFGWIAALALVVATEVVARELMFGVEFAAAVLLFSAGDRIRPFVPVVAVVLVLLGLIRLGLSPEVTFH